MRTPWMLRAPHVPQFGNHCIIRIDWLKPFLTNHGITCGANGLNSYICLWCNTTVVGRKVRFHRTLPLMTKQRCSAAAATRRRHQKFGIIDISVATSDLSWHQMWCLRYISDVWCFADKSDVDWLGCFCFPHFLSFRTKISHLSP